jgi:hypothetical protein
MAGGWIGLKGNHRQTGTGTGMPGCIFPQKLSGRQIYSIFHSQNIIGGQCLIQIPAALIKTRIIRTAVELHKVIQADRQHLIVHFFPLLF